jgi:hypothetical protein
LLPLTPRALLLLGIGDPALVVGVLALTGALQIIAPVPFVLTVAGVVLNAMAVVEIIKTAGARRGDG